MQTQYGYSALVLFDHYFLASPHKQLPHSRLRRGKTLRKEKYINQNSCKNNKKKRKSTNIAHSHHQS